MDDWPIFKESQESDIQKPSIRLPMIALCLVISPVFLLFLVALIPQLFIFLLFAVIFPFVGFILGITALVQGKKRIGTAGLVISITAIALPIVVIGAFILLVETGALVFGM